MEIYRIRALKPSMYLLALNLFFTVLLILRFPCTAQASPGDLDPTFGTGGGVTTDFFGGFDAASAIALQPDGKIVAAGYTVNTLGTYDFALARYNPDGSLDTSFGSSGKVTTDFFGRDDFVRALALQPDGKIVTAGYTVNTLGTYDFALARYNPDGSLDQSFGTGGLVTTDFFGGSDWAFALALQPDGKIVAAGGTVNTLGTYDFALARYSTDGSLDQSFGTGGLLATDFFGGSDRASAVALQPDGKIVAAGSTVNTLGTYDFALARYNPDGSLDQSLGTGGLVTTDFFGGSDWAFALALQPDGKIVAAGAADTTTTTFKDFALARYTADGSLDQSFGTGGKVTTGFGGMDDWAQALVLQADGKIVAAGDANPITTGFLSYFALARYTADGSLDQSFGTGGKVTTAFVGSASPASAVALQSDGKIVAAGYVEFIIDDVFPSTDFALARYLSDFILTVSLNPTSVTGGSTSTGTVILSAAAPAEGAVVALSSSNPSVAAVPASVTVPAGATSASFWVSTNAVTASITVTVSGIYSGTTRSAELSVNPVSAPDTEPPDTSITSAVDGNGASVPNGGTTLSSAITLTLTATDNIAVAGFECRLDGGDFAPCTSPVTRSGLAVGGHSFEVRAVDTSGNRDGSPVAHVWSVDAPPDTIITSAVDGRGNAIPNGGTTRSATITFSFAGSDNVGVGGFECSLDGAAFAACASPKTYGGIARGTHTFRVRAVDSNGFRDQSPAALTWRRR